MSDIDNIRIPWPGPRPYDEEDWEKFSGRDPELTEILNRVRVNKVTILLGGSGTGKTSLIRAGLVPLLRQERYHPQGDQTTWPVLLLRRWGNVGSNSLEDDLLLQLESGIEAIRLWGERLKQEKASIEAACLSRELSALRENATVLETIESLARAEVPSSGEGQNDMEAPRRGGLILIFDQFEEQLRASSQARAHALELIGQLVSSKAPTRILLSLRREYQYALRPLERAVGGLSGRSYFLEPLKEPTVIEIVTESSSRSNIPIAKGVANRIVRWLSYQKVSGGSATNGAASDKEGETYDEAGRPDLLQLQAVLRELTKFALRSQRSSIEMPLLDEFSLQFWENGNSPTGVCQYDELVLPEAMTEEERARERSLAQKVLGGALERWIESALKDGGQEKDRNKLSAVNRMIRSQIDWAGMSAEDLRLQVRRIAVRLAPRLSSGDYKVSQEENALFRQALGDEIARLGFKDPELLSKVRIIDNEDRPPRVDWEALPELPVVEVKSVLSGLARVEKWTPKQTGDKILLAFKEALHRLAAANILQYTTTGAEKRLYWELVHDQLGPSFTRWADRQRGTWDDCKNSLVVCSGIQPIAVTVPEIHPPSGLDSYVLRKVSWRGCGVENSKIEDSKPVRLRLRNVLFEECFLVGTIFSNVDFIGCSFINCDLDGGLFRDCTFKSDGNKRTTFVHCDANIAIVGGSIEGLEFNDCQLLQPTIRRAALIGDLLYSGRSRVVQGYFNLNLDLSAKDTRILFDAESRAAMCLAAPGSFSRLKFENTNLDFRNYSLEEDYTVRSEKRPS